jgi:Uma2 family endonuclease
MSVTVSSPGTSKSPALVAGQRLDQAEFHERYASMPPGTRAELIHGVVAMPSPVGIEHGRAQVPALVWLSYYQENTPGVEALDNASAALGPKSEPQPDAILRVLPEYGGRTQTDQGFLQLVPELIVEVAHTSRYTDLGPKLEDYERAGVREYLVRALEPDDIHWFVLTNGRFVELEIGADGFYRSEVFPGLWLDPHALIAGDTRRLRAVVDLGIASSSHAAFVARLAANVGNA